MIIVATIIGILGGVVIFLIDPQRAMDRSADSVRLGTVGKIVEAAEAYANLEGNYPTQAQLEGSVYINSWPTDVPKSGDTYDYSQSGSTFTVYTEKSDGSYYKYFSTQGRTYDCPASGSAYSDCDSINN
jgi:hypothetical protein